MVLPPTVPAATILHLPTLRVSGSRVMADIAFTQQVPQAHRAGHVVALGIDWGLNTLMSAGTCRLSLDGTITALGAGAQYRAGGASPGSTGCAARAKLCTPSSTAISNSPPNATTIPSRRKPRSSGMRPAMSPAAART
jgi:hypothetical protein